MLPDAAIPAAHYNGHNEREILLQSDIRDSTCDTRDSGALGRGGKEWPTTTQHLTFKFFGIVPCSSQNVEEAHDFTAGGICAQGSFLLANGQPSPVRPE
jgi:hypothetical protein